MSLSDAYMWTKSVFYLFLDLCAVPGAYEFKNKMLCVIWYHLYNLKNVKNTNGGVLLLVKLYKWCQIAQSITYTFLSAYPSAALECHRNVLQHRSAIITGHKSANVLEFCRREY